MARLRPIQRSLFADDADEKVRSEKSSSTFIDNMRLPVHRWFRYSAGFSAEWAENLIRETADGKVIRVLDPFAGSGTTILAAQDAEAESIGIEAHPFVCRIARAKLLRRTDPDVYLTWMRAIRKNAARLLSAPLGCAELDLDAGNSSSQICFVTQKHR